MKIKDVITILNQWAPAAYQEPYDNATLITGQAETILTGVLITLDCTEEIIDEAIQTKSNLIIAHHPIVFKGLKSFTGKTYVERTIIKAIKNDVAIFSIHTNLDHVHTGVNKKICDLLGLQNCKVLDPKTDVLSMLVTFVPPTHVDLVLGALHQAGAGNIGNYDHCSFQVEGKGTYRPNDLAKPFLGKTNQLEATNEVRIEVVFPTFLEGKILSTLRSAHPYEEVAYYLTALKNKNQEVGAGMIGELLHETPSIEFLASLKNIFNLKIIRHTHLSHSNVKKIAVCGGAGSFLLSKAKSAGAEVFVTADFKYHEFFDAENEIIIADIGHYESEVFTKELIYGFLREKLANIALNLSKRDTNPIKYF